ncbi:MAG: hypothetical protein ACREEB_10825 [Caulobacteraceae bacterium]
MFETALSPQDPPADDEAPDPSVVLAEQQLCMLRELAEIGMELARALRPGAAVEAPADDKSHGKVRDPADAFWTVSRAVRLTLALEAKTDEALRDLKAGVVRKAEKAGTALPGQRALKAREARGAQVTELVDHVAMAECETWEDYFGVCKALSERLSEDEAYWDIDERPLRETVERLCRDLTLSPDWSRWDREGWTPDEGPRKRPPFSYFHTPSARPLVNRDEYGQERPTPPWRLHSDREPAANDPAANALAEHALE